MRSRASVVTCFHRDYRDLAEIPVGKQPINPWARSSTNKMTTRNMFCRVLQPVPRIIDPRKICDSIEPVYLTWYFFPRFFFFFFTLFFFLPHHGYVERFQNHWTEKSSRSERYAINQSVAITSTVSQYTISPSISPSHASTRIHCYTHTVIYSHVHIIILSHMFIRIFRHKALKHVRTTWANSYTRETHRT